MDFTDFSRGVIHVWKDSTVLMADIVRKALDRDKTNTNNIYNLLSGIYVILDLLNK